MDFETWYEQEIARIFKAPEVGSRFAILERALYNTNLDSGMVIECGVHEGKTINFLAGELAQVVHGFDSFEGLPEDWVASHPKGTFDMEGVLPAVPANVKLWPGWFSDTLPAFVAQYKPFTIKLLHIDCDLYSSTVDVLTHLGPYFNEGTVICFDELIHYPEHKEHEIKAWYEYCMATDIKADPIVKTPFQQVAYKVKEVGNDNIWLKGKR